MKSKEKLSIPIVLNVPTPSAKKNEYNYAEKVLMKILDGNEVTISCSFSVPEPKYTTKCETFANPPVLCQGHELN